MTVAPNGDERPATPDTTTATRDTDTGTAADASFRDCAQCGMRVRSEELSIHLAHAHNVDMDAKKPKKKSSSRDRRH